MEQTRYQTLLSSHSLLSSAKYNNQCWTGVCSAVASTNEESINLNKSGLYLRPETAGAFQLVPGHKYKQRKTCNNSRGSLDLYLWTLTGDKLIPHRENYFCLFVENNYVDKGGM